MDRCKLRLGGGTHSNPNAELLQSDVLVKEMQEADIIVLGRPIYNFLTPAAFKAWFNPPPSVVAESSVEFFSWLSRNRTKYNSGHYQLGILYSPVPTGRCA